MARARKQGPNSGERAGNEIEASDRKKGLERVRSNLFNKNVIFKTISEQKEICEIQLSQKLVSAGVDKGYASNFVKKLSEKRGVVTAQFFDAIADAVTIMLEVEGGIAKKQGGNTLSLPDRAPELYMDRKDKSENPLQFFRRIWGQLADQGILFQDDIRALGDDKLVPNLRTYCHKKGLDLANIIPPPSRRLEMALEKLDPSDPLYRALEMKLSDRERVRRHRAAQKSAKP